MGLLSEGLMEICSGFQIAHSPDMRTSGSWRRNERRVCEVTAPGRVDGDRMMLDVHIRRGLRPVSSASMVFIGAARTSGWGGFEPQPAGGGDRKATFRRERLR